jgi:hypothetical protein
MQELKETLSLTEIDEIAQGIAGKILRVWQDYLKNENHRLGDLARVEKRMKGLLWHAGAKLDEVKLPDDDVFNGRTVRNQILNESYLLVRGIKS